MMTLEYWQEAIKSTQAPWDLEAENYFNNLEWEQYFKWQESMARRLGFDKHAERTKNFFAEMEELEILNGIRPIPFERRHEFSRTIK